MHSYPLLRKTALPVALFFLPLASLCGQEIRSQTALSYDTNFNPANPLMKLTPATNQTGPTLDLFDIAGNEACAFSSQTGGLLTCNDVGQKVTTGSSFTLGDLECYATGKVSNCTPASNNSYYIGIAVAGAANGTGSIQFLGAAAVNSQISSTFTSGDVVCTDPSNASVVVDNGLAVCPPGSVQVGVAVGDSGATLQHQVALKSGAISGGSGSFSAGNDLTGTSSSQSVIGVHFGSTRQALSGTALTAGQCMGLSAGVIGGINCLSSTSGTLLNQQNTTGPFTGTGSFITVYTYTLLANTIAAGNGVAINFDMVCNLGGSCAANNQFRVIMNGVTLISTASPQAENRITGGINVWNTTGATGYNGDAIGLVAEDSTISNVATTSNGFSWGSNQIITVQFSGPGTMSMTGLVFAAQLLPALGTSVFGALSSGTNTSASMIVGSGASLGPGGTGTIQATGLSPMGKTISVCTTGCAYTSLQAAFNDIGTNLTNPLTIYDHVCGDALTWSGTNPFAPTANTFLAVVADPCATPYTVTNRLILGDRDKLMCAGAYGTTGTAGGTQFEGCSLAPTATFPGSVSSVNQAYIPDPSTALTASSTTATCPSTTYTDLWLKYAWATADGTETSNSLESADLQPGAGKCIQTVLPALPAGAQGLTLYAVICTVTGCGGAGKEQFLACTGAQGTCITGNGGVAIWGGSQTITIDGITTGTGFTASCGTNCRTTGKSPPSGTNGTGAVVTFNNTLGGTINHSGYTAGTTFQGWSVDCAVWNSGWSVDGTNAAGVPLANVGIYIANAQELSGVDHVRVRDCALNDLVAEGRAGQGQTGGVNADGFSFISVDDANSALSCSGGVCQGGTPPLNAGAILPTNARSFSPSSILIDATAMRAVNGFTCTPNATGSLTTRCLTVVGGAPFIPTTATAGRSTPVRNGHCEGTTGLVYCAEAIGASIIFENIQGSNGTNSHVVHFDSGSLNSVAINIMPPSSGVCPIQDDVNNYGCAGSFDSNLAEFTAGAVVPLESTGNYFGPLTTTNAQVTQPVNGAIAMGLNRATDTQSGGWWLRGQTKSLSPAVDMFTVSTAGDVNNAGGTAFAGTQLYLNGICKLVSNVCPTYGAIRMNGNSNTLGTPKTMPFIEVALDNMSGFTGGTVHTWSPNVPGQECLYDTNSVIPPNYCGTELSSGHGVAGTPYNVPTVPGVFQAPPIVNNIPYFSGNGCGNAANTGCAVTGVEKLTMSDSGAALAIQTGGTAAGAPLGITGAQIPSMIAQTVVAPGGNGVFDCLSSVAITGCTTATANQNFSTTATIPANALATGRRVTVTIGFQTIEVTGGTTFLWSIKVGPTAVFTVNSSALVATKYGRLTFDLIGTAAPSGCGGGCAVDVFAPAMIENGAQFINTIGPQVTLVTNGSLVIQPTGTFGAATLTNQTELMYLEVTYQ